MPASRSPGRRTPTSSTIISPADVFASAEPVKGVTLVAASEADFDWMIRGDGLSKRDFALPPGGVDEVPHLEMLRGVARRLRSAGIPLWMILAGDEVVGLCSYKDAPTADGSVEIGYEIAPARRRCGHATAAVSALLGAARTDPDVCTVLAETVVDNVASQRVLTKNGFRRIGTRTDPVDGELILWRIDLAATKPGHDRVGPESTSVDPAGD